MNFTEGPARPVLHPPPYRTHRTMGEVLQGVPAGEAEISFVRYQIKRGVGYQQAIKLLDRPAPPIGRPPK